VSQDSKPSKSEIVVVGSLVFDLVTFADRRPRAGETLIGRSFGMYPGGKGANQALQAARLGAAVTMAGRVGDDYFGRGLLDLLQREGVNTVGIGLDQEFGTSASQILVDRTGENSIVNVPQANAAFKPEHLEPVEETLDRCAVLLLQLEIPQGTSIAAAKAATRSGATVILDPAPAPETLSPELLKLSRVLTPNAIEASALSGIEVTGPQSAVEAARELGGGPELTVVVTLGDQGCVVVGEDGDSHLPAISVEAVDATAAGDAFNGALATALANGRSIAEAVVPASLAGAYAVTRPGAMTSLGNREELDVFGAGSTTG
jgi:ribokinase